MPPVVTIDNYILTTRQDILTTGFSGVMDEVSMTSPVGKPVENYLGRIAPQHRDQPMFEAMVEALAQYLSDVQTAVLRFPQHYDLDESIGHQEDVNGELIGRSRNINIPLPTLYFSFDDAARGFDKGIWKGPYDTESGITVLDDETYRLLLRAKIAANNWDGTVPGAQAALEIFFNDPDTKMFIEDKMDMSMVYGISGKIPSILILELFSKGYIPLKPGGVKTYYLVTSLNNDQMFGFDIENEYIAGFDHGTWGVDPDYIVQNPIY